ncbi:unnamed protein product [Cyclocybe aegerita]|uniref:Uncharacterized protein n=1 Tax=Cyclocybe aegerita TaxID=1973307 RepID=A0A8S0VT29_CYCAE|nr:unnamed protein product [Cyclocybe aegerita]
MPPKKRKNAEAEVDDPQEETSTKKQKHQPSEAHSEKEVGSNSTKGILVLPSGLWTETLKNLQAIGPLTRAPSDTPVLPETYLERTDALRALSQVCVAYRRAFLPVLWESFTACCSARVSAKTKPGSFYKHNGEALLRKCAGLTANPELAGFVRGAHVILTRYQAATLIPTFSAALGKLPNLHTLHVLHAHTAMTTALKTGFEGVALPQIRTLIIPGNGHEILRSCPHVLTVRCTSEDGSKLITVIGKHCLDVQEMHGFCTEESYMKRIVKAAPNLRVFEISTYNPESVVQFLPKFKNINTVIIRTPRSREDKQAAALQACIRTVVKGFKYLPPSREERRVRLWHDDWETRQSESGGFFTEVDLEQA